jgi:hypothetical protein
VPRINDDTQAYPSDWVRDNPITTTERMTMTERTITEAELKKVLSTVSLLNTVVGEAIQQRAFPPLFTPKEGEAIVVSQHERFKNSKIRVFCYINDDNEYVCFMNGSVESTTTVCYTYAKPQTPTQKGEG